MQPSLSDSEDLEEMERLRKEHIEALREIKRLQVRPPFVTAQRLNVYFLLTPIHTSC